jgi:transcriptional regulator with XRE-family HTH domain
MRTCLVQKRQSLGLSQIELAKLSGVSYGTLSRIERGWIKPRKETMDKIASALCCNEEEVFLVEEQQDLKRRPS